MKAAVWPVQISISVNLPCTVACLIQEVDGRQNSRHARKSQTRSQQTSRACIPVRGSEADGSRFAWEWIFLRKHWEQTEKTAVHHMPKQ